MRILVPEAVAQFDLRMPVGNRNPGGGMSVKYARVEEALRQRYPDVRRVSTLAEVETESVIVDALWFLDNLASKVDAFLTRKFRFAMLYGSQECLLTWPNKHRVKLLSGIDVITHNCDYQRAMYRACGIHHSQFLCDPVPEHVFYPAPKVPRIFASGQISIEKNTPALIALFEMLQGSGIETGYLGSATMWGETVSSASVAMRYRLQSELEAVTDTFMGNLSQAEVARISNASAYHVHVAHYDCSCQNQQEAAMGGAVLFGLRHPINAERPVMQCHEISELAASIIKVHGIDDGRPLGEEAVHEYAMSHWSYAAFLSQFDRILQGV